MIQQKIEQLIEEAATMTASKQDISELTKVYISSFDFRNYTNKDIQNFMDSKNTKLLIRKENNKIVGVLRIRYLNPNDDKYLIKLSRKPKILFISDLISKKPGQGRELLKYAIQMAKREKLELITSAWKKELIPYYVKNGFILKNVDSNKLNMLKYGG